MKQRRFCFDIPATISICIDAETEAQAWLRLKVLKPQFSALPYGETQRWIICKLDYGEAMLFAKEVPLDDSKIWD